MGAWSGLVVGGMVFHEGVFACKRSIFNYIMWIFFLSASRTFVYILINHKHTIFLH